VIINFSDSTQVICNYQKALNYYRTVKDSIATVFINDELVYNWSTGLDNFLIYTPGVLKQGGVKHNNKKPQMSLLFKQFPKALEAIVKCSEYGNSKYSDFDHDFLNFQRVSGGSKTYADASLRHRLQSGLDEESGLPHAYHIAWNALAELELYIKENENN